MSKFCVKASLIDHDLKSSEYAVDLYFYISKLGSNKDYKADVYHFGHTSSCYSTNLSQADYSRLAERLKNVASDAFVLCEIKGTACSIDFKELGIQRLKLTLTSKRNELHQKLLDAYYSRETTGDQATMAVGTAIDEQVNQHPNYLRFEIKNSNAKLEITKYSAEQMKEFHSDVTQAPKIAEMLLQKVATNEKLHSLGVRKTDEAIHVAPTMPAKPSDKQKWAQIQSAKTTKVEVPSVYGGSWDDDPVMVAQEHPHQPRLVCNPINSNRHIQFIENEAMSGIKHPARELDEHHGSVHGVRGGYGDRLGGIGRGYGLAHRGDMQGRGIDNGRSNPNPSDGQW